MKKTEYVFTMKENTKEITKEITNTKLYDNLFAYKNQITMHHRSKMWDNAKRHTNAFELVQRTPQPVSRSFFKLWEMLHDYPDIFESNTLSKDTYCLLNTRPTMPSQL